MIHIQIIQIGKTKDSYFVESENEYLKRLSSYAKIEVITLPEAKTGDDHHKAIEIEGKSIVEKIKKNHEVIALDITGKEYSSEMFSMYLGNVSMHGKITFIIGGPYGLSQEVLSRANSRLSLSKMTFTHQMVRTILLEQVYRAFTIIQGKKYHY